MGLVIVGALGLIGRALAAFSAKEFDQVVLVDLDQKALDSMAEKLERKTACRVGVLPLEPNNGQPGETIVRFVERMKPSPSCLVNTAYPAKELLARAHQSEAGVRFGDFVGEHVGFFLSVTTSFSAFLATRGGGSIVNLSSIYGQRVPRLSIYENTEVFPHLEYGAAKIAIEGFSRQLAAKHLKARVRINCVAPGGLARDQSLLFREQYGRYSARGDLLDPDDVVPAINFLLSEGASAITGQTLLVDEGFSLG